MTIKHRFVFRSDDGEDEQEVIVDPGQTFVLIPKRTAMYTLFPGKERFAMVQHSTRVIINSKDHPGDIWGNEPVKVEEIDVKEEPHR